MQDAAKKPVAKLNFRSGRDFDYVGLCSTGFVGCGCTDGLRCLSGNVWGVPDACPAGGGRKRGPARGGTGSGGQRLDFVWVWVCRRAAPFFQMLILVIGAEFAAAVGASAAAARRSAAVS